ncbi:flagellar hook-length control protein FliK [Paenibacillus hexagrammi]|uniref:Flagellar hook-length control protein FliK n=1 Tax=Paenibacillus hexagrammi TaxID=2908839 RepID=A0ABY3SQJ1_9BACL|nr:flagellar hook-length control protein FliK [Paenibacillus sp. YPD9-1]UJF35326.1 flagellar hook-length control protein FliK [Paenibacillus sp. YPD9-1]
MNISGLIRSLVGDLQASDSKVLELKVGQVVKGVVLQLMNDQEAMINIGGVQVRAKLETPLKQGDVTMLQVQPESGNGQVLLKPLLASDVQIADESMNELLRAFSLKDTAGNRQLVQQIQQQGVPLTKETAQSFAAVLQQIPEGMEKEEWVQAAVLAYKRGLPLTKDTVAALRQTTAGPPAGQVLDNLMEQSETLLQEQPDHPAADTLKQVVSLLRELRESTPAAWTGKQPQPKADAAAAPARPAASQAGQEPPAAPDAPPAASTGSAAPAAGKPAAAPSAAAGHTASAAPRAEASPAGSAQPPAEVPPARPALAGAVPAAQARSAEPAASGEPPLAGSPAPAPPAEPKAAGRPQAQQPEAAPARAEADREPNWISRMLKSVGVEHEHHLAKLDDRSDALQRPRLQQDDQMLDLIARSEPQAGAEKPAAAETLKSLLLQLTASDDTPAPLKEAAQQAVQQVTGQQLMLSSDRASMFAHLTLFIPFMDNSGQQSAAVHIQSRKGKRGEVDANNCRLLFDLQMKSMGSTLVDVQVVNKIVSLHIHNDHPAVSALIEGSRQEIAASMNKAGYQFLSLKVSPFPEPIQANEGEGKLNGHSEALKADLRSLYEPKTYKGVDFRA